MGPGSSGNSSLLLALVMVETIDFPVAELASPVSLMSDREPDTPNSLRSLRAVVRPFSSDMDGAVAELVGIEGGVVSEVINLESSGVEAPDRRPRHDQYYHEYRFLAA
jgi:hypothetical protein